MYSVPVHAMSYGQAVSMLTTNLGVYNFTDLENLTYFIYNMYVKWVQGRSDVKLYVSYFGTGLRKLYHRRNEIGKENSLYRYSSMIKKGNEWLLLTDIESASFITNYIYEKMHSDEFWKYGSELLCGRVYHLIFNDRVEGK